MPTPEDLSWIPFCSETEFRTRIESLDPVGRRVALAVRGRTDPLLFARVGMGHAFRLPPAPFHRELAAWHGRMGEEELATREGLRFALAAPRGFAKSTIASFLLVLHDLFYRRERYIVLVSATQRQAQQRLRALRGELVPGRPLPEWFGWTRGDVAGCGRVIEARETRVEAFGAGTEMRGITHGSWRPTKIILDDAESSASARSPRRRARLAEWFAEVVEHLGGPYTHLLVVGTVLHPAGLLASLLARPDYTTRRCAAIGRFAEPSPRWEEWRGLLTEAALPDARERARAFFLGHRAEMERGTEVLWPEHRDYERLAAQLVLQGRRAFYQEMQNEPLGPEDALFDPGAARRVVLRQGEVRVRAPGAGGEERIVGREADLRRFGYLDSALGGARRGGDFAALATVDLAAGGLLLCRRMWVRRATPSQQVAALFDLNEEHPFELVGIEGTGFQELLGELIHAEGERRRAVGRRGDVPVRVVRPTAPKPTRIATLEPLVASGRLALDEALPEEFWQELASYPRSEHDDALDALAGAVTLAREAAEAHARSRDILGAGPRRSPSP